MSLTSKALELTAHQNHSSKIPFCLAVHVGWESVGRLKLCSKENTTSALLFTYYMDVKNLVHQLVAICIHHIKGEGEASAGIPFAVAVHHVPWGEGEQKTDALVQAAAFNPYFGSRLAPSAEAPGALQGSWIWVSKFFFSILFLLLRETF